MNTRPYLVKHLEVEGEDTRLTVPQAYGGAALLLHRRGRLCGFTVVHGNRELSGRDLLPFCEAQPDRPNGRCGTLPSLTIAICTRNRTDLLSRCLDSIVTGHGEHSQIDILVIDNAPSNDETRRFIESRAGIRYVVEPRRGLGFARNKALEASSADYIAYIDDDAILDPGWIEGFYTAVAENPDAAGLSGPILPLEVASEAQILLEGRGGYCRSFRPRRYGATLPEAPLYPCGDASFGSGANLVLRRSVLAMLGGFDDALGSGTATLAGEDLDIFYRLVRAGHIWAYSPRMAVLHLHRRELHELAGQVHGWATGTVSYLVKSYHIDVKNRSNIMLFLLLMGCRKLAGIGASLLGLRSYRWPVSLAVAEFRGYCRGFMGTYKKSVAITERERRLHAEAKGTYEAAAI
jgi:glycosyltransferase involved in cell wall biosynthesis